MIQIINIVMFINVVRGLTCVFFFFNLLNLMGIFGYIEQNNKFFNFFCDSRLDC